MIDFFISYTQADQKWAEWIAFALEDKGFSVSFQIWDFRPGANFVLQMQEAATKAKRTVLVLSPDYLSSRFAQSEWAAAFAEDPLGVEGKLLPVKVRKCEPTGLLRQIVWIDLVGLSEADAGKRLIEGLERKRAKPEGRPAFPGGSPAASRPQETTRPVSGSPSPYVPAIGRKPTDADRRRFIRAAFATIVDMFRAGVDSLKSSQMGRIDGDIEFRGDTDFVAEVFVDGKSSCLCHIWIGNLMSRDGISYFEGRSFSDNAINELLSIADDGYDLFLSASMGQSFARREETNLNRMSAEQAADYLWRRFIQPLERG